METVVEAPRLPKSVLLVGASGTGKSTQIADALVKREGAKVLWLACDNTGAFVSKPALLADWEVVVVRDWAHFEAIKNEVLTGKRAPDVIVVDGLAALSRLCQDNKFPQGMTLKDWGVMSKSVHNSVRALRGTADIYATVTLKPTDYAEQGKRPDVVMEYDLNADLKKRLVTEFDTKLFTHAEDTKDGREYFALVTPSFAFDPSQAN